ncbi:MAG TPA: hypothetical protein VK559_11395 [Ferruginibacter sp.]|nr:hypothetical protein [Ferruginibacter sp.]
MRETIQKSPKNTSPAMEISHKLALIDKLLRDGYDTTIKYLNDEDKSFLSGIKNSNLQNEMLKWEQRLYALK